MFSLKKRSYKPELLDNDDIPFEDIKRNMKELNIVNRWLGGHNISINGIQQIMQAHLTAQPITICEIGCGGGDNLAAIAGWCERKDVTVKLIGIDIKQACTAYAAQQYPSLHANWITNDYKRTSFDRKPDIIFSSLFCHHFHEEELISMMQWMQANSNFGFFINDLQRHPLAYLLIKIITRTFSRSYLVRNDAPLSVARGFRRNEWYDILQSAGIPTFSIQWKWAFRYLIVHKKTGTGVI